MNVHSTSMLTSTHNDWKYLNQRCGRRAREANVAVRSTSGGTEQAQLRRRIASFYDESSSLWEQVWGSEHMHHGLYPSGLQRNDHHQAQVDMMDAVLRFSGCNLQEVESLLDAGCGIGGAARYLLQQKVADDCYACGITLSEQQARRAGELAERDGLDDATDFFVGDVMDMAFEHSSFDLAWSLEVGEHVPDRDAFVSEMCRVTAPSGHVLIVAWTRRELVLGEEELPVNEQLLLSTISRAYHLPQWSAASEYVNALKRNGMHNIRSADWSLEVSPFWGAVMQTAVSPNAVSELLGTGADTISGAMAMPLMQLGYQMGTVRFSVFSAVKPDEGV